MIKFNRELTDEAIQAKWPYNDPLKCPVCGGIFNHPIKTVVTKGFDSQQLGGYWDVDGNASAVFVNDESKVPNRSRGNDVLIFFLCENNCRWVRRYAFHKGCTYADDIKLPDFDPELEQEEQL